MPQSGLPTLPIQETSAGSRHSLGARTMPTLAVAVRTPQPTAYSTISPRLPLSAAAMRGAPAPAPTTAAPPTARSYQELEAALGWQGTTGMSRLARVTFWACAAREV